MSDLGLINGRPRWLTRYSESASLNIEALFKKYGQTEGEPWKKYGRVNDWNIDLVPKLLMANGELTNILVSTDVTKYLEFKQIAGSYVQQGSGPKATVAKVPSDAGEALKSPLMGIFEKRRMKSFIEWVGTFDPKDYLGYGTNRLPVMGLFEKRRARNFLEWVGAYKAEDPATHKGECPLEQSTSGWEH